MRVMFLDESGDHNLAVIDPSYPLFVLGGVIVDQRYAEGPLERRCGISSAACSGERTSFCTRRTSLAIGTDLSG